jgi:hypothetical protein
MTQDEVHDVLEEPSRPFQKGFSPNLVEAYNQTGIHVYYDNDKRVEYVEAFPPAQPVYANVSPLGRETAQVVEELVRLGVSARRDGEGGFWFDDHGFVLYSPDQQVEAVSAFRRGYDTGA